MLEANMIPERKEKDNKNKILVVAVKSENCRIEKEIEMPLFFFKYLSRGLCLPRAKSILTLLTATSSSFNIAPPFFCEVNK